MDFIKKYRHGLLLLGYAVLYLIAFHFLETRRIASYHLIHSALDDMIPFCEVFVIPYLLWFPYQILAVLYFIFLNDNRTEYYRLAANLMMGMTVFLAVSWLYPNGHLLRPDFFPRDNFLTRLTALVYAIDTPTNILPSIHVFNSLAVHMALVNCEQLKSNRAVRAESLILTVLIILSTMLLKQHSTVDVALGATMAYSGYLLFYSRRSRVRMRRRTRSARLS